MPEKNLSLIYFNYNYSFVSQTGIRVGTLSTTIADGKHEAEGIAAIDWTFHEIKSTNDRFQ